MEYELSDTFVDGDLRLLMRIGPIKYDPETKKYYATKKAMKLSEEETLKLVREACEKDEERMNEYVA